MERSGQVRSFRGLAAWEAKAAAIIDCISDVEVNIGINMNIVNIYIRYVVNINIKYLVNINIKYLVNVYIQY